MSATTNIKKILGDLHTDLPEGEKTDFAHALAATIKTATHRYGDTPFVVALREQLKDVYVARPDNKYLSCG